MKNKFGKIIMMGLVLFILMTATAIATQNTKMGVFVSDITSGTTMTFNVSEDTEGNYFFSENFAISGTQLAVQLGNTDNLPLDFNEDYVLYTYIDDVLEETTNFRGGQGEINNDDIESMAYSKLTGEPTALSEFSNDLDFTTSAQVNATPVSIFSNDVGYITSAGTFSPINVAFTNETNIFTANQTFTNIDSDAIYLNGGSSFLTYNVDDNAIDISGGARRLRINDILFDSATRIQPSDGLAAGTDSFALLFDGTTTGGVWGWKSGTAGSFILSGTPLYMNGQNNLDDPNMVYDNTRFEFNDQIFTNDTIILDNVKNCNSLDTTGTGEIVCGTDEGVTDLSDYAVNNATSNNFGNSIFLTKGVDDDDRLWISCDNTQNTGTTDDRCAILLRSLYQRVQINFQPNETQDIRLFFEDDPDFSNTRWTVMAKPLVNGGNFEFADQTGGTVFTIFQGGSIQSERHVGITDGFSFVFNGDVDSSVNLTSSGGTIITESDFQADTITAQSFDLDSGNSIVLNADSGSNVTIAHNSGEDTIQLSNKLQTGDGILMTSSQRVTLDNDLGGDNDLFFDTGRNAATVTGNFTVQNPNIFTSEGTTVIGSSGTPQNITMFSPNGSQFTCGVDNTGTFSCS